MKASCSSSDSGRRAHISESELAIPLGPGGLRRILGVNTGLGPDTSSVRFPHVGPICECRLICRCL